jgi:hypothetical protein
MKPRHVAHVGRVGSKDWNVVRYASDGDFVLVTNNASDFRQLYATQPLQSAERDAGHRGLAEVDGQARNRASSPEVEDASPRGFFRNPAAAGRRRQWQLS